MKIFVQYNLKTTMALRFLPHKENSKIGLYFLKKFNITN